MRMAEALELARNAFRNHFRREGRTIPQELAQRLGVSASHHKKEAWSIEVYLYPESGGENGLWTDLIDPRPTLIVTVRVQNDGSTTVTEERGIPW